MAAKTTAKKATSRQGKKAPKKEPRPIAAMVNGSRRRTAAGSLADNIIVPTASDRLGTMIPTKTHPLTIETYLEAALSGAPERSHKVFARMEDTWPRLAKNLHQLKTAASSARYNVKPYAKRGEQPTPEAQAKADFVEAAIERMSPSARKGENGFSASIYDVCDAVGKGLSLQEILWKRNSDGIVPRATCWIDPRYYEYDPQGVELGMVHPGFGWQPLVDHKFILGAYKNKSGNALGYGLMRPLAWWWGATIYGRGWLVRYAEQFGIPMRVVKYPKSMSKESDRQALVDALIEMGAAGIAAIPDGSEITLQEAAKGGSDNPQAFLLELADKICDILVLGQTLTTDVGDSGSRALGDVHESVQKSRQVEVAEFAVNTLNEQLIPSIVELNWGGREELPYLELEIEESNDPVQSAQRDQILSSMGLPLSKSELYERHGLQEPENEEDTLAPPSSPEPDPGFFLGRDGRREVKAMGSDRLPDNDQLRRTVFESLTGVSEDYAGPVKHQFGRLVSLAQRGDVSDEELLESLERFQEQLPELFDQFNQDSLQQALNNAISSSLVNGAVDRAEQVVTV